MEFRNRVQRHRAGLPLVLFGAAAALIALLSRPFGPGFSAAPGLTRKQQRAMQYSPRANLPGVLEIPLEQPEVELEEEEPLPERRVPYSLHVVSHFPNNEHLHEESSARKVIEHKIVASFHAFEEMIRHVEVNLQVLGHFHRDKPVKHKSAGEVLLDDGELVPEPIDKGFTAKALTPYIFKVSVTLRNHRTIVLANAEKHAQPTLTEGLDHMVDVIKRSLKEEKDKFIQARRTAKLDPDLEAVGGVSVEDEAMDADALAEQIEQEASQVIDKMYEKMEARKDQE